MAICIKIEREKNEFNNLYPLTTNDIDIVTIVISNNYIVFFLFRIVLTVSQEL